MRSISARQVRGFIDNLDLLSEQLTPARRPQDQDLPDCSRTELRVLAALARQEPVKTTVLAIALEVPASTLTRTIDRLVRKGLVHRKRDRRDRRVIEIGFSPVGKEINCFVAGARLRRARQVLTRLNAADRVRLCGYLANLVNGPRASRS